MYGDLFVDMTAARAHGLPPAAYSRVCAQSDKLHAMLSNPFYLVTSAVPWLFTVYICLYIL